MYRPASFLAALVLIAALAWPVAALAETLGTGDRSAIRALIGSQIAAFQRDDGEAAYAMASPGIQATFPTAAHFMTMVREGYQPVYRPRSVVFGALVETGRGPVQKVLVTGPDGQAYVAVYALQRQADGTWRISGCTLLKDDSPSI